MAELQLTTDATVPRGRELTVTVTESSGAATDSFTEVSESPNLHAHQGYTTDGSDHYSFDTTYVCKWNGSFHLIGKNLSPLAHLPPEVNHLGDGDYHAPENEIHVPVVLWNSTTDNGSPVVAVYDAGDLSYKRHCALDSGAGGGASGIWVDDENGVAWVSDFLDSDAPLYKYDLTDYSLLDSLSASSGVPQVQGVFFRDGYFYLPSHDTHTTHVLDESGDTRQEIAHHSGGAYEGVDYSGDRFAVLHDPNGNSEGHVHFYVQDTTVINAETVTVEDGENTYALSGFRGGGTDVRIEADVESAGCATAPRLHSASVRFPSAPEAAAVTTRGPRNETPVSGR